MKKTLIATAIAAVAFSGTAMGQATATSADSRADELAARMDSMPQVYGNIQYAIAYDDIDGGPSTLEHFDNGTTLGVSHEHDFAPGVTGFFKLELEGINADDKARSNGIDGLDEAYIGVKGDNFGQIWIGSDDSTYERAVDEISQYYEVAILNIGADYTTGEGDLVQYMSPSFGGLKLMAAVEVRGDGEPGVDDSRFPFQLAAIYSVDALELAVAMDSNDNGDGNSENSYGLRASYDMDNFRVTGEYHTRSDSSDTIGVIGYYTLGANTFALSYEMAEADNSDLERDTITFQALHNLSDHMYVYFEGYLGGGDDVYLYNENGAVDDAADAIGVSDERSIASIGAVYYF
ncbi:porin [Marinobacter salicampi]|uniref:porin n=1 Tax=Marinobacter salicampi TaxID=435907 RepID=UPI001409AD16|nr:porin [Marinobacter salicampi]